MTLHKKLKFKRIEIFINGIIQALEIRTRVEKTKPPPII